MTKGKQWVTQDLPIDDIRTHSGLQPRVGGIDPTNLRRIVATLQNGGEARDPIDVARVGKALYVVDGFHRLAAYRLERRPTIPARVAKMSLEEATGYARVANAANGKGLSRVDKQALWETYVAEGRHLDDGVPRSSRAIAGELGHLYSHETIRKKLRALGLHLDEDVEYDGHYRSRGPSEEDLELYRLEDAEDAVGKLGGLLATLTPHDRDRLIGKARAILDAVEHGDDEERQAALGDLRAPLLDI